MASPKTPPGVLAGNPPCPGPYVWYRPGGGRGFAYQNCETVSNAGRLFRHLRKHRRDINAWYVIRKDTGDYRRLRAAGYKRIVPYGSFLWKLLCLNAKYIVSSHAARYVHEPAELRGPAAPDGSSSSCSTVSSKTIFHGG